jgi:hypothetical protein
VALNAEFNFKSARLGWTASQASSSGAPDASNGAVPMDLSQAEDEEAELQADEQRIGIFDVMCAETCTTCVQVSRCASSARLFRAVALPSLSPGGALASHEHTSARK